IAPTDLAGIRFLFIHRIDRPPLQYIKVAAARRHVLVSDQVRNQPFLDSAFAVADVIEPELDAFVYRLVGEGQIEGRLCQFIEAVPKDRSRHPYGKTVVAIDPVDHLILRRELYDDTGTLLKVNIAESIEKIEGNWIVRRNRMKSLDDGRSSLLEVREINFRVALADQMFRPEYLVR
ncbi:MAG TPA: outer membrane lipoprotein-sorting protein, partial [Terriglobales bacterium]|nr:outer membrane lipoprotein-sorting protein [Terriglobales bacterium]